MPLVAQHPGVERKFNRDVSTSYVFTAADDYSITPRTVITGIAGFQIVVQRLLLNVTTDNAATQTWQDNTGTPIPFAGSKASPGVGPITFDFGEDGYVLADGKSLMHKMSAAGMAGAVAIQAYLRPTPDTAITANVAGTRGFSV